MRSLRFLCIFPRLVHLELMDLTFSSASFSSVAVYGCHLHQKQQNEFETELNYRKKTKITKQRLFDGSDFWPDSLWESDEKLSDGMRQTTRNLQPNMT